MRQLSLTDPIVIKGAGGLALYLFGGSELCKLGGLALAGWAALEYFTPPPAAAATSSPAPALGPQAKGDGPDAAGRMPGELFYGWPANYTPSVRQARDGENQGGGKVIPLRGGDDG